ncbi:MAG: 4-hydroxy-tetrahydrodipicolinate synthase [Proteobacteria bacterium]|nr:4-hydroxy-tetrahydrodipicolinate synthase [Pseudomonadota bacterium]
MKSPTTPRFAGSCVALLTPMTSTGELDEEGVRRLIAHHRAAGSHGILAVGTTGESPTLSHDEHKQVVEWCIDAVHAGGGGSPSKTSGQRPWLLAGTGSNATHEAIDLTRHAGNAGADGVLVVTPYYNKPSQAGLVKHFTAIADASQVPVLIYDIPGRSAVAMADATLAELAKHPNIVGIKDSSQDLARPTWIAGEIGVEFAQMSGEDGTALPYRAGGGHGCISVTANLAPGLLREMHEAWDKGDAAGALAIHKRLMPLHAALFCEASPQPVKYGAKLLGLIECDHLRLPLTEISDASKARVRAALVAVGLLAQ